MIVPSLLIFRFNEWLLIKFTGSLIGCGLAKSFFQFAGNVLAGFPLDAFDGDGGLALGSDFDGVFFHYIPLTRFMRIAATKVR